MDLRIFPPDEILENTVALPLSKSEGARRLIMDYISGGSKALSDPSLTADCDDLRVLREVLGSGLQDGDIDLGSSGTALRLLTAVCAATENLRCRLTGSDSLRNRPVGPLVDALRALGADISYGVREGYAPLVITGRKLRGGDVKVSTDISSQFASAIMLAAPLMAAPPRITLTGAGNSMPYIKMTAAMMTRRGVPAEIEHTVITVGAGNYRPDNSISDERDWSSASFWYEIAALTAGWITLSGLKTDSLQGDRTIASVFEKLGVVSEDGEDGVELSASPEIFSTLEADMSGTPDAVPAVAVTCALIGVPFILNGVGALRHKESDRLGALCSELEKIGVIVEIENYDTTLRWDGTRRPIRELPVFDPRSDHRMAMALAPTAVYLPGIVIRNAECVAKSYPEFWNQLREAGFRTADPSAPLPAPEGGEQ